MRYVIVLVALLLSMPNQTQAQMNYGTGVVIGTGQYHTKSGINGVYLKGGIMVTDHWEANYTIGGVFFQKATAINPTTVCKETMMSVGQKFSVLRHSPHKRFSVGYGLIVENNTVTVVSKTVQDALDYQWTIWHRSQGIWANPNAPLVRLSDFRKMESLVKQGFGSKETCVKLSILGGVALNKHIRLEAEYVLMDLKRPLNFTQYLSTLGFSYRYDF